MKDNQVLTTIKSVAIIGMGALGLMYADQLTSGLGDSITVSFVMDAARALRHSADIYSINGETKSFNIVSEENATPADLVIVAVKFIDLPAALDTMKNCVGSDTIILSVMNGISSERIIAEKYGWDKMIYSVAQGMDAMRDGTTLRFTKTGKLHIGATDAAMSKRLESVIELFEVAGLPHFVEEDIMYRLWFKYMLNVGINQICMVYDTNYGTATTEGTEANLACMGAMREVLALAPHNGVSLSEDDLGKVIDILKTLDPEGYPSMAQDRKAGRKSEVDMFAGEVIRQGKLYGVPTPVNADLYKRVQEIESKYN